ncbi:MAG TPA: tRNA (adenosine(37)-N6)-threonylcarbamoyltransferase complex transferase subunit TsaD [Alphaproteobacteria bacterium]|nr:tRNA (adenosine(37)-N6)-threonylcarbamoyltransferase complex transferase subunit TsaD [Alphaproteobacteria bacterium]
MIVLGIETSCDETAAAVVRDDGAVLAERLLSQVDAHRPYGGVVPEIAARAHLDHIDRLISEAMGEAGLAFSSLDGVAATGGPGLIGGVIVGVMTGKAIAAVTGRPFLAINHLEGHALSARLAAAAPFPYLLLLVSGGHCQLLAVEAVGRYRRLGTTIDDAAGEAFDKGAKLLGLGYPGGPAIEAAARRGNPARFPLPRPLLGRPGCDFSFSGLKTAMRQHVETLGDSLDAQAVADLAAGFQAAVADVLADRTTRALAAFKESHPDGNTLVVAGGVAANLSLRVRLEAVATAQGFRFLAPPQRLCTDNAAMIAWAGIERLKLGLTTPLDFAPRPRWPLDPSAPTARGAGIKA